MTKPTFTSSDCPLSPKERFLLDLGVVFETAQICVNGVTLPPIAFPPYQADITTCLQEGQNELVVIVANTNADTFEHQE